MKKNWNLHVSLTDKNENAIDCEIACEMESIVKVWAQYSARWRPGDSFRFALFFVLHWP